MGGRGSVFYYESRWKIKPGLNENFQIQSGKQIFKDYTDHTFKFFYLERGRGDSNCKIKFNLQTIPDRKSVV